MLYRYVPENIIHYMCSELTLYKEEQTIKLKGVEDNE